MSCFISGYNKFHLRTNHTLYCAWRFFQTCPTIIKAFMLHFVCLFSR